MTPREWFLLAMALLSVAIILYHGYVIDRLTSERNAAREERDAAKTLASQNEAFARHWHAKTQESWAILRRIAAAQAAGENVSVRVVDASQVETAVLVESTDLSGLTSTQIGRLH